MNIKIKAASVIIIFISLNSIGNTAPPSKSTYEWTPNPNTSSAHCRVVSAQNMCQVLRLDSGIKFQKNISSPIINQVAENRTPTKVPETLTVTVTAHDNNDAYTIRSLENNGFVSARFGVSRAAHNTRLQAVDSETSNEHAQVNMLIQLNEVPTIEKYVNFFTHSGYFTIAR